MMKICTYDESMRSLTILKCTQSTLPLNDSSFIDIHTV